MKNTSGKARQHIPARNADKKIEELEEILHAYSRYKRNTELDFTHLTKSALMEIRSSCIKTRDSLLREGSPHRKRLRELILRLEKVTKRLETVDQELKSRKKV